jgi:hypothetical protein
LSKLKRNLNPLPPLMPEGCGTAMQPERPHSTPDVAVESFLFGSYLREKARADRLLAELKALKDERKTSRAWGRMRKLSRLKPVTTDVPARKGKGL